MTRHLTRFLRPLLCAWVLAAAGLASAGSYEDFFNGIKQDNPQEVKELLIRGFDPNTVDPKNQAGLHLAIKEPSLKVAQVLAEWPKTDVNKLNAQGESALMLAALKGYFQVAEQLVQRSADVNKTGWTPLHYAASGGQLKIIAMLLENHAYIDAESPNGTTPLMMAAMYGSTAAVQLLLQEGADTKIKNQRGLTALNFAQQANRPDAVQAIAIAIKSKQSAGQW